MSLVNENSGVFKILYPFLLVGTSPKNVSDTNESVALGPAIERIKKEAGTVNDDMAKRFISNITSPSTHGNVVLFNFEESYDTYNTI